MSVSVTFEGRDSLQGKVGGPYRGGVGEKIPEGGEIFNDYENNTAPGKFASARNRNTHANADFSDASGYGSSTSKEATAASVEGYDCHVNAPAGHAEGYDAVVDAPYGHAQNHHTHVKEGATGASAGGRGTIAASPYQDVRGKFNVEDAEGKYVEIVGNGTSDKNRSNAGTTDWEDNVDFAGDVRSKGKKLATLDEVGGRPIIESTEYPGCYYRIVDGEKEWFNPPLAPDTGEFRTTQRYGIKPLYVQMVSFDALPTGTTSKTIGVPADAAIRMEGWATNADASLKYPLPMSDGANTRIYMLLNSKGTLFMKAVTDYSTWSACVTLWYTKN